MQAVVSKTRLPAIADSSSTRGLLLRREPTRRSRRALSTDTRSSILACCVPQYCAHWPRKMPGRMRIHPHLVDAVRNQVGLAGELRNPEAVVGVGGQQLQERRSRPRRIAHRNVQLVGRDDAERRIAVLPPELMPDDRDFEGGRRLWRVLDRVNHARRRQRTARRRSGPG